MSVCLLTMASGAASWLYLAPAALEPLVQRYARPRGDRLQVPAAARGERLQPNIRKRVTAHGQRSPTIATRTAVGDRDSGLQYAKSQGLATGFNGISTPYVEPNGFTTPSVGLHFNGSFHI